MPHHGMSPLCSKPPAASCFTQRESQPPRRAPQGPACSLAGRPEAPRVRSWPPSGVPSSSPAARSAPAPWPPHVPLAPGARSGLLTSVVTSTVKPSLTAFKDPPRLLPAAQRRLPRRRRRSRRPASRAVRDGPLPSAPRPRHASAVGSSPSLLAERAFEMEQTRPEPPDDPVAFPRAAP